MELVLKFQVKAGQSAARLQSAVNKQEDQVQGHPQLQKVTRLNPGYIRQTLFQIRTKIKLQIKGDWLEVQASWLGTYCSKTQFPHARMHTQTHTHMHACTHTYTHTKKDNTAQNFSTEGKLWRRWSHRAQSLAHQKCPLTSFCCCCYCCLNCSYFLPRLISSGLLPGSKEKWTPANFATYSSSTVCVEFI